MGHSSKGRTRAQSCPTATVSDGWRATYCVHWKAWLRMSPACATTRSTGTDSAWHAHRHARAVHTRNKQNARGAVETSKADEVGPGRLNPSPFNRAVQPHTRKVLVCSGGRCVCVPRCAYGPWAWEPGRHEPIHAATHSAESRAHTERHCTASRSRATACAVHACTPCSLAQRMTGQDGVHRPRESSRRMCDVKPLAQHT